MTNWLTASTDALRDEIAVTLGEFEWVQHVATGKRVLAPKEENFTKGDSWIDAHGKEPLAELAYHWVPDYCNSLDAIAPVERLVLSKVGEAVYIGTLGAVNDWPKSNAPTFAQWQSMYVSDLAHEEFGSVSDVCRLVTATAEQRSRAICLCMEEE